MTPWSPLRARARALALGVAIGAALVTAAYATVYRQEITESIDKRWNGWRQERRGAADARRDILDGRLTLKTAGLQFASPCDAAEKRVFHRLYGLRHVQAAGCVLDEPLSRYLIGYNHVVERHLAQTFGHDWLERAHSEAAAECQASARGAPSDGGMR